MLLKEAAAAASPSHFLAGIWLQVKGEKLRILVLHI